MPGLFWKEVAEQDSPTLLFSSWVRDFMNSFRLPYPWKIVVAAAVVALLIMGVRELPRLWRPKALVTNPAPIEEPPSGLYADTLARVQEIIAVHTSSSPEVVTPAMSLVDLGIDPLTRVEIADAIETAYRIELPAEELTKAATVDELVQLIVKLQQ
ncbi:MAG: acyl carrier protein [Pirellulaceae bacterium]